MGEGNGNDNVMLEQRIAGRSVIAIAEEYGCTTADVEGAIDRRLGFDLTNELRMRAVKLDVARLEALMVPFFERATKDRDCAAGTLCVKILERRALLLGLDQPVQSKIDVYQVQEHQGPSRHERIRAAVLRLTGGPLTPGNGNGAAPSVAPDDPEPK